MEKKISRILQTFMIGIFFGLSFGFLTSYIIETIRECFLNGFLNTLFSEKSHYNWNSSVNKIIIITSTFFCVVLSLITLLKPKKNRLQEAQSEFPKKKENRIRENLNVLTKSNDWDTFFLAQENRDYFKANPDYFVDILVEKTLTEIEEKKRIGDKPTIEVYESYISHVEKHERFSDDDFKNVFCWTKNKLCENLIYKMRDAETYEDYVCYKLAYEYVVHQEKYTYSPFGFLFNYLSYLTLSKDSWNLLFEAKSITGLPQIDTKEIPPHIWSEYELYEKYLYELEGPNARYVNALLGVKSQNDVDKIEKTVIHLSFNEWTEAKKRKSEEEKKHKIEEEEKHRLEEESRRIAAEKKRKATELKARENSYVANIGYSIGGGRTYMNMPPRVCVFCGGTGFRYGTNSFGESVRNYCVDCNGTGYINGLGTMQSRCIFCGGTGFHEYTDTFGFLQRRSCLDCGGTGYMIPGWGT